MVFGEFPHLNFGKYIFETNFYSNGNSRRIYKSVRLQNLDHLLIQYSLPKSGGGVFPGHHEQAGVAGYLHIRRGVDPRTRGK